MRKLRILHVANHFWPCMGGVEKITEDLCLGLNKRGHRASVLCLNKCAYSEEKLPKSGSYKGIGITRVPFIDARYYKIADFNLEILKKYDVIHVHGISFFSDYLALTKPLHKRPLVLNTHGGIFHTQSISQVKNAYFNLLGRAALAKFDKVIADSKNDYTIFRKIAPKEKLVLIENGVDVEKFLGLKPKLGSKKIIFIGRLSKNKRVDLLIKAFGIAAKNEPAARLYIAGGDWEKILPELRKSAKESSAEDKIVFLGKVSDAKLMKRMSECAFFASASRYEGFGISTIEAMAAGLVPILQPNESFKEFVSDGKNGFLADFDSTEKAAEKIKKAFGTAKKALERMGAKAREKSKEYSWDKKIPEFEKIYLDLAA